MINDKKAVEFIRSKGHIGDAYGLRCLNSNQTYRPDACSRAKPAREGHLVGFFESDRHPVSPSEIPCFIELMACARVEMLLLVRDLPEETLDWKPEPGSWSVQETLRHVA
jgi:hypothetical protein